MAAQNQSQTASLTCPACRQDVRSQPLERHKDPIAGIEYRLISCPGCGVVFSEPRTSVGPEWYSQSCAGKERASEGDWRYRTFFHEDLHGELLDLGCGSGQFLLAARERGFKVSGLDFNPEYIRNLQALGVPDVRAMDIQSFFRDCASLYDIVTLFDVLEHVPEPAELLSGIAGILRPEGRLVLTVPNGERPILSPVDREGWDYPPFHFTRWNRASLERVLGCSGFKVLRVECSPLPHGFFSSLWYYRLLKSVFPFFKKILLGVRTEEAQKTWTEILLPEPESRRGSPAGFFRRRLSDPALRQSLTDAGLKIFSGTLWPLEAPCILWLRALRPLSGKTLYVLAARR